MRIRIQEKLQKEIFRKKSLSDLNKNSFFSLWKKSINKTFICFICVCYQVRIGQCTGMDDFTTANSLCFKTSSFMTHRKIECSRPRIEVGLYIFMLSHIVFISFPYFSILFFCLGFPNFEIVEGHWRTTTQQNTLRILGIVLF